LISILISNNVSYLFSTGYIKKGATVKMKANNVFRVMTAAFLVIAFTVSIISCKEAPVEEQPAEEEKPAVEVSNETNKEQTKEETSPVVEEKAPEEIEYKGVVFPLPEASEANPQTGEILALYPN